MTVFNWTTVIAIALIGIAFLMHIAKSPRDAHGKNRK
jgi:hypothetical protein